MYIANTAYGFSRGEALKYRYTDLLEGTIPEEDNRSGDEIAADVIKTIGLKVKA